MGKIAKAVGYGAKHFFSFGGTRQAGRTTGRALRQHTDVVSRARILSALTLHMAVKGSPVGLLKNLKDSIQLGRWRYQDLKGYQDEAVDFCEQAGFSEEGIREIRRALNNGAAMANDMELNLSPQDRHLLSLLENDLAKEAGNCVNF